MRRSTPIRAAVLGIALVLLSGVLVAQSPPAQAAPVATTAQANARAMVESGRLSFGTSSSQAQMQAYADGYEFINLATGRACNINDILLDALRRIVVDQGFSIRIVSLNRWCEGNEPTAWWQYHVVNGGGHAVDIIRVNGVSSTGATAQDIALVKAISNVLPTPAGLGQMNCGQSVSLPSGWVRFADSCDHLHLEFRGTDTPVADLLPTPVPVYRFWSAKYEGHFYTADPVERDTVISRWSNVWAYEGQRYTAYATQVLGTVPLYRFWSARYNGHFYTADPVERDTVIARWPDVWSYEGVAYYVYPLTPTEPNTVPVARFWSASAQHHFYTASAAERDTVRSRWPNVWKYEGDNFRVPSAGVWTG